MSSAEFSRVFTERGYAALAPDSRAHGESGGDVVTYGLLEKYDVLDWAHWMRKQGCARLYGVGESLGAALLIQASAVEPAFSAIVAESAYADLQDAAEHRLLGLLPMPLARVAVVCGKIYARFVYGLNFGDASPLDAIRASRTPILLIHGLSDNQTPPEHSRRLAAASGAEVWLVPGLGHGSAISVSRSAYERRVFGWFEAH